MFVLLVQLPTAAPPPTRRQCSHLRRSLSFLSARDPIPNDLQPIQPASLSNSNPAPRNRWPGFALFIFTLLFITYLAAIHPWFINWGATEEEQQMSLPGDLAMNIGRHRFTRAISVDAPPPTVWRWIAQMGQDRAGFYSNTWLQNMFGLNIHTADEIVPGWQKPKVGDLVLLAPRDYLGGHFSEFTETRIVGMETEHWIAFPPFHFALQSFGQNGTRLLIRESRPDSWVDRFLNALFWDPFHFIMEARMLRGIKEHAEGVPLVRWQLRFTGRVGWMLFTVLLLYTFMREPDRLPFVLLPMLWAALVVMSTNDWDAAIAAFVAVGIPIAATIVWGHRSWIALLLSAESALLVLTIVPDPFCFLGITLGAITMLRLLVVF